MHDTRGNILDLEPEIRDLTRWALLATQKCFDAVGNLSHRDGKCIEPPDSEDIAMVLLVVDQVHYRAKKLEAKFADLAGSPEREPA